MAAFAVLSLIALGKDDGFDYEAEPVSLVDWKKEGPIWADKIYNQAFEYGEEWSDMDLRVINTNKRINTNQPLTVPRFTHAGFKKAKIPKDLYRMVKAFLHEHEERKQQEVNIPGYLNNVRCPTYMININEHIRRTVFEESAKLLEAWIDKDVYAGDVQLEPTACYGIRRYTNGSTLQSHVDRGDTHAVSAILHIDDDKEEDWPLQILDHQGKLHEVFIQPGEMVYYESARLVHGRPHPFKGKRYDNLFVHFRPRNDWPLARG